MKISVDPTLCAGYGLCRELLPEVIALDEWGYPILAATEAPRTTAYVPVEAEKFAKNAAVNCPRLALKISK